MKIRRKKIFISILFFSSLGLAIFIGIYKQTYKKNPNVVMIVIDALRYDHLSMNGYERKTSPFLDSFAKESIYFSHVITNGSWTAPNVTTMLTGLHPQEHKVDRNEFPKKDFLYLAEILNDENYNTGGFSANQNVNKKYELDQGFDYFYPREFTTNDEGELDFPDISTLLTNASAWLEQINLSSPFFLYLQPMNTHGPYPSSDEAKKLFLDETGGSFEYYGEIMRSIMNDNVIENHQLVNDSYLQDLTNQYDAAIYYTDQQLANFIQELKDRGVYDDTILIITADHGEELYDHNGFSHGYAMYQETLDTFLMIKPQKKAPRKIKKMIGIKYNHYVEQLDLLPTILNLLRIPATEKMTGQYILNQQKYQSKPIVTKSGWKHRLIGQAVTQWPFKLIYTKQNYRGKENKIELYNIEQDPGEQNDISAINSEVKEKLKSYLLK